MQNQIETNQGTTFTSLRLSQMPQRIKLIPCPACHIATNHNQLENGNWVCWCGCEVKINDKNVDNEMDRE